ncbi:MAG: hypothetical protein CSB02_00545 [Bacteroidia bacterium]|nr:MAG: hypothetical protein CSB02_00545 [Bacteroidia bacterium]
MYYTRRKIVFRWLSILWGITIISISSIPHLSTPNIHIGFRLDHIAHFGMYFVLAVFIILWKTDKHGLFEKGQYAVFMLFGCLFAIADETHQIWIPGRTFAWQDMLSNILGFTGGMVGVSYIYKRYFVN